MFRSGSWKWRTRPEGVKTWAEQEPRMSDTNVRVLFGVFGLLALLGALRVLPKETLNARGVGHVQVIRRTSSGSN